MNKLVIIGGGPGGYETAIYAAKQGIDTTLIESSKLGGCCLNEGCIPTKALVHASSLFEQLLSGQESSLNYQNLNFSMSAFQSKKEQIIEESVAGIKQELALSGVKLLEGKATLLNEHTIQVGKDTLEAESIIIATGASPIILDFGVKTLTSKELLDSSEITPNLVIIGGGVIGLEFASIYASLKSQVTVIERNPQILTGFDEGSVKALRVILKKKGVNFICGKGVTKIEATPSGQQVILDDGTLIPCQTVLQGIGRKPNLEVLGKVKLTITRKGISVNSVYQTSVPNIYAIGDVNGLMMTAYAASAEGRCVIDHLLNKSSNDNLQNLTKVVFTNPPLAEVGENSNTLKSKGIPFTTYKAYFASNGYARATNETNGDIRLYVGEDETILGADILGSMAQELIAIIQVAIHNKMKVNNLKELVLMHPTLSEIIITALRKK
ncbi:MAG: NAD(P)/FAD-dependent oxidoreductase [Bacilli bacterium]|nr:NAD(P)/FAD-dependent oxidoreductase [Bacilli bacterium]MDD3422507.1 NAD(P)/FAD-dependent oxidoreductase [Bacilli bacterium]